MITANRNTPMLSQGMFPKTSLLPVAAGKHLFDGEMIILDTSGYAKSVNDSGEADPWATVIGRCDHEVDNTDGAAGAKTVQVSEGVFGYPAHPLDPIGQDRIGYLCYAADNGTLAATPALALAGTVCAIEGDMVYVSIGKLATTLVSLQQQFTVPQISARMFEFIGTGMSGTSFILNLGPTPGESDLILGVEVLLPRRFSGGGITDMSLALGTDTAPTALIEAADLSTFPTDGRPHTVVIGKATCLLSRTDRIIATLSSASNLSAISDGIGRVVIYSMPIAGYESLAPLP